MVLSLSSSIFACLSARRRSKVFWSLRSPVQWYNKISVSMYTIYHQRTDAQKIINSSTYQTLRNDFHFKKNSICHKPCNGKPHLFLFPSHLFHWNNNSQRSNNLQLELCENYQPLHNSILKNSRLIPFPDTVSKQVQA